MGVSGSRYMGLSSKEFGNGLNGRGRARTVCCGTENKARKKQLKKLAKKGGFCVER